MNADRSIRALQSIASSRAPQTLLVCQISARSASKKFNFEKNKFCLVSLFENASKFSHFCLGSFSAVSTDFSILSSVSGRIRPHLALNIQKLQNNIHKKFQNFKTFLTKCEKQAFSYLKFDLKNQNKIEFRLQFFIVSGPPSLCALPYGQ